MLHKFVCHCGHYDTEDVPLDSTQKLKLLLFVVLKGRSSKATYTCQLCFSHFTSQEKTCRHVCISPEGTLSCFGRCSSGRRLSNVQCDLLFSDRQGHLCDSCGEVFAQKVQLEMHMTSVHNIPTERSERYTCHHCGAAFGKRFILEKHIWGKHSAEPREKTHICDICGKAYLDQGGLNRHIKRIHTQGKKFQCQYCSKSYFMRNLWMTHVRQHLGESPHHCKVCNQGFSSKYALVVHERIHTGEKPYKCKQCEAAFAQKTSLDVHMKKHQKGDGGGGSSVPGHGYAEQANSSDHHPAYSSYLGTYY